MTASIPDPQPPKKGWRFVVIFCALCMTAFLSALDTSIISTALPTIAADLDSETLYVWTINSYLLASTAVQPLFGQAANIFGRRSLYCPDCLPGFCNARSAAWLSVKMIACCI
ncbi:hypothetical protein CNMCM8980_005142 [Aspergillus fumigatiaffinis]|nr:hypothetical protein CNMCM8980_005142 [Aspergillus fumigatiaffinis]